ncbi:MAG: HEPN domain-containing protein [bacterium]
MRLETTLWLRKAEGDFRVARHVLAVTDEPVYEAVSFHAQQCVEKYLKACLIEWEIPFPNSHNLSLLLRLLVPRQPLWAGYLPQMLILTAYAVAPRYPPEDVDLETATESLQIATHLRSLFREALGV